MSNRHELAKAANLIKSMMKTHVPPELKKRKLKVLKQTKF
jgi:hypothetical protein